MLNHGAPSCQRAGGASMMRLLRPLLELEGDAVEAVAQACRRGAVVENMAEMGAATRAEDFVAFHSEAVVFHRRDDSRDERLGEAGPAGAGLELRVAREQRRVTTSAMENPATMFGEKDGRTGALGRVAAQNGVLLRSQLLFPFRVRFLHFRNGREIFGGWFQRFHIFDGSLLSFLRVRLPRKID